MQRFYLFDFMNEIKAKREYYLFFYKRIKEKGDVTQSEDLENDPINHVQ